MAQTFTTADLDAMEGKRTFTTADLDAMEQPRERILERFGKQLWNAAVGGTVKAVREKSNLGQVPRDTEVSKQARLLGYEQHGISPDDPDYYQRIGDWYKQRKAEIGDEAFTKEQEALNTEAGRRADLILNKRRSEPLAGIPGTAGQIAAGNVLPVQPAEGIGEQLTDVGAGLAGFVGQLAITRRAFPGMAEPMIWEMANEANGGLPGKGAAMAATFGGINKIPAATLVGKAGKLALESGAMAGITAVEGGTSEDIAIASLIPIALKAPGGAASIVRGSSRPLPEPAPLPPTRSGELKDIVAPERMPFLRKVGEKVVVRPGHEREEYLASFKLKSNDPEYVEQELIKQGFTQAEAVRYSDDFVPESETTANVGTEPRTLDPKKARLIGTFEHEADVYAREHGVSIEEAARTLEISRNRGVGPTGQKRPADTEIPGRAEPAAYVFKSREPTTYETVPVEKWVDVEPYDQETRFAIEESKRSGKPVDEIIAFNRALRGTQEQQTVPLTDREADTARELGVVDLMPEEARKVLITAGALEPKELELVRRTAGDSLVKALQWTWNFGEPPTDPALRRAYVDNLREASRRIKRIESKQAKDEIRDKTANVINRWQSADKVLDTVELAAGRPLRMIYHGMVSKANQARSRGRDLVVNALDAVIDLKKFKMDRTENENIKWWLFKGDKSRFDKLSTDGKKVAIALQSILRDYAADRIRAFRFWRWEKYGVVPPDVPAKEAKGILEAGRVARENGRFDEWIKTQTWGTREVYYPADSDKDFVALDELIAPGSLEAGEGRTPGTDVRAAHTRERGQRPVPGNVVETVIRHVQGVDSALAVKDDVPGFWENFTRAKPSPGDSEIMRNYLNTVVGKTTHYNWLDRTVTKVFPWFWKFYFLDPLKNGWWFVRNLGQNMALGASQLNVPDSARAVTKILLDHAEGKVNEQRVRHFQEDFESRIRQDQAMFRHAMMMDEGIAPEVRSKISNAVETVGEVSMWSEKANRLSAWATAHQIAQDAIKALENGKIDTGKFQGRLLLDTMMLSQRAELDGYLKTKDYDTFIRRYAEYKAEAINFSYDTALRSAMEQTPTGRAFAGILVFPRGVYNIAVTNGLLPIYNGIASKNYGQAERGLRNVIALYAGATTTNWLYEKVTGRKGTYNLSGMLGYNLGAPGFNVIATVLSDINQVNYQYGQGQLDETKAAERIASILFNQAQLANPLSTAIIRFHASVAGEKDKQMWQLVRSELDKKYTKRHTTKVKRTEWEAVMHFLFGGYKEKER